eukprot:5999602-Amphidinium_carterae.1
MITTIGTVALDVIRSGFCGSSSLIQRTYRGPTSEPLILTGMTLFPQLTSHQVIHRVTPKEENQIGQV